MKYEKPELNIYELSVEDTIRTSPPVVEEGEEDSVTWG